MRLTIINFFKKSPNGHIFRGKHRLVKPVSNRSVRTLHREYELQEQNMIYLLNPYLTVVIICLFVYYLHFAYYSHKIFQFFFDRKNHTVMLKH